MSNPMHVLHVIDSGGLYGAERMLLMLVEEQLSQGLHPMILSVGEPGLPKKAIELEAERLGLPLIRWPMRSGFNVRGMLKIIKWANSEGYTFLHSHNYKFNILFGAVWPAKPSNQRWICTIHGYTANMAKTKLHPRRILETLASPSIDGFAYVNPSTRPSLTFRNQTHTFIPNPTNLLKRAKSRRNLQVINNREVLNIVAIGRLSDEKGFDLLLKGLHIARDKAPNIFLKIYGTGPCQDKLMRLIEQLELKNRVKFEGYTDDISNVLASADLFVLSSRAEGMPMTIIEAVSSGIPILATAVGAVPWMLEHYPAATLIEPNDPTGLADRLVEHATHRRHVTDEDIAVTLRKFDVREVTRSYTRLYKGILPNA